MRLVVDYWSEHHRFPVADWKYEVANDDTRMGYWDWVEHKIETDGDEDGEGDENKA